VATHRLAFLSGPIKMGFDGPLKSGETVDRSQQEGFGREVVGNLRWVKFPPFKGLDFSIGF